MQPEVTSPIIKGMRKKPLMAADLTWQGLSAWVKEKPQASSSLLWNCLGTSPRRRKLVLNNVNGIARSGTLTAILGPSGAGKTTLLSALANRFSGEIRGDIRINGWPVDGDMLRLSTFVPQQALFIETLTTREHLEFMMGLQYPDYSSEYRSLRVKELLKELGLRPTASISSLSGGERKRLVFASQILTDPPILFCDEPTSGLDSHTAHTIISLLEQLAARGRTIICSIHQPASKVFSVFSNLIILCEGRVAFLGKRQEAEAFFLSLGYRCPQNYNPADFYVQLLLQVGGGGGGPGSRTGGVGLAGEGRPRQVHEICDSFAASNLAADTTHAIQKLKDLASDGDHADLLANCDQQVGGRGGGGQSRRRGRSVLFGSDWWTQLYWLTWRCWLDSIRNPSVHLIRTLHKVMTAVLMALCFADVKLNQNGIQDIEGALFIFLTENNFPSSYAVLNIFPQEIPMFLRERRNELYRTDTYYVSKIFSMIPGFCIEPFLFTTIAYWMIGLRPHPLAFLMTALVLIFTANVACAYGCLLSTAFETLEICTTLMIPINQIVIVSAGLYINIKTIPAFLTWFRYLSWMKYGNEALTIIQWKNVTGIECREPMRNLSSPCIQDGDQVIESLGFESANLPRDIFVLIAIASTFHFLAFVCLWCRGYAVRRQRRVVHLESVTA